MGKVIKHLAGGKPKKQKAAAPVNPVTQGAGPTQDKATIQAAQDDLERKRRLATVLSDSTGGAPETLG